MSDLHNQKAREILEKISYATVATVTPDGKAWNTPVAHDMDQDLNLYWYSDKENEHSKNIRNNPNVYIVIYDSTAPDGEGEGVYIQAQAKELTDEAEINQALSLNPNNTSTTADFLGDTVRRCYKATPQKMWTNDAEEINGVFIRDYRVELNLLK